MRAALALLAVFVSLVLAEVHPLRPIDLVSFHKVSSPVPSLNGRHALFSASRYNPTENETKKALWLLNLEDNSVVNLGGNVVGDPIWLGDGVIAGIGSGSGSQQVWFADVSHLLNDTSLRDKPEFHQLTDYPIDIANLKFHVNTSTLAFTAEVYEDGSLETARKKIEEEKNRHYSAVVYDQLFVRHWDVYVHPERHNNLFIVKLKIDGSSVALDGNATNLMAGEGLETPVPPFGDASNFAFSPDGKEIAFATRAPKRSIAWNTNVDIYTVPTDGSEKPVGLSVKNKGADTVPVYSPDGKYLVWLQMRTPQYEADKNQIVLYDRETGKVRNLASKWDRSAESLAWTADSHHLILTAQDRGHVKIFKLSIKSRKVKPIVEQHTNGGLSVVGDTLFFEQNSAVAPAEIYTLDLSEKSAAPTQRTWFNNDLLLQTLLSDPEEFWFRGASGDSVMGWLFKPVTFHSQARYPLAFLIHGGPEGAWNDGWSYRWNPQIFTGAGYAVVVINFHGSTGYGPDFTKSILKHWGGRPYHDLMRGLDFALENFPFIDSKRVAALGASYGGYMINWINGHTNRFKCLVNHDGTFNTLSSYYSTDELYFMESEFGGPPFPQGRKSKPNRIYEKWNPAAFVHKWSTPTLVIHGEKDYRLPVTEGLSTFTALQRRGVPSRLVYFPDENHWVLKPGNSLKWHAEVLGWLDRWVGSGRHLTAESLDNEPELDEWMDEMDQEDDQQQVPDHSPSLVFQHDEGAMMVEQMA
ncbi:hypothetical protein SpCBS45565_g08016 [Spizellomyces sp. 'palustris']|nr:hypothetical protein SpCBS45565_g08016 [Spizellomyces sp. 'palustris']